MRNCMCMTTKYVGMDSGYKKIGLDSCFTIRRIMNINDIEQYYAATTCCFRQISSMISIFPT